MWSKGRARAPTAWQRCRRRSLQNTVEEHSNFFKYLELRFSTTIRFLGSIVFCLQMMFYMSVALYAPSLALSHVTSLSMWISVLGVGLVCTLYTAMGGLRAVVYTDTFQAIIIIAGTLCLIIKAVVDVGGVAEVWRINKEGSRFHNALDFNPDPRTSHTVWSLVIGGATTTISLYGINQTIVQRYLAVHKLRHAQATVYINLPATVLSITLFVILGLVAYARYYQCDPLLSRRIDAFDQLIPLMVMDVLGKYPGLPGLFVACVFSASLSTVSSGVNALALVYLEDGVKPVYNVIKKKDLSEREAVVVTKVLAVVFGLLTIGLAFVTGFVEQTLVTFAIRTQGMTGGPLLGLFILAMFFPCTNSWGAGVGLLSGLAFSFWLGVGTFLHGHPPSILPISIHNCSATMTSLAPVVASTLAGNFTSTLVTSTTTTLTNAATTSVGSAFFGSSTTSAGVASVSDSGDKGLGIYELSYLWYAVVSSLVVIVIGLFVSFVTGCGDKKDVDPNLIIPVWQMLKDCVACRRKRYDIRSSDTEKQDDKTNQEMSSASRHPLMP